MKLTKIFGIVLSLHLVVILLVMFQPGCQTVDKEKPKGQNPTETQDPSPGKSSFNQGVEPAPSGGGQAAKP